MEMGLTEEQANKVMESLNGLFVTKARFNEVNTELKQAKDAIQQRDTQLETLKKSAGVKNQITELQAANATKDQEHAAELKSAKINNAVEVALITATAKNNTAVKALLTLSQRPKL